MIYDNLPTLLQLARELSLEEDPVLAEVAGVALELARANTLVLEALEPLKDILREEATDDRPPGCEVIEFEGAVPCDGFYRDAGVLTVTFPDPVIKLNDKGKKKVSQLRHRLGPHLGDLFEENYSLSPRAEFRDRVGVLPDDMRDYVLSCVTQVTPTPRVGFRHVEDE